MILGRRCHCKTVKHHQHHKWTEADHLPSKRKSSLVLWATGKEEKKNLPLTLIHFSPHSSIFKVLPCAVFLGELCVCQPLFSCTTWHHSYGSTRRCILLIFLHCFNIQHLRSSLNSITSRNLSLLFYNLWFFWSLKTAYEWQSKGKISNTTTPTTIVAGGQGFLFTYMKSESASAMDGSAGRVWLAVSTPHTCPLLAGAIMSSHRFSLTTNLIATSKVPYKFFCILYITALLISVFCSWFFHFLNMQGCLLLSSSSAVTY